MSDRGFDGRRVFITGGSAGIGLETAREAVRQGAHVCIAGRSIDRLDAALASLEDVRPHADRIVTAVRMDVRSAGDVDAAAAEAIRRLGSLDLLINNAGYAIAGYARDLPERAWDDMLDVNYKGMVRVIRAVLPHLIARRAGHIVNVSSVLGFMGMYGYTAYAPSKFAIAGYTHCLRQELLEHGIRVSIFYPPTTDTPGLARENESKPPECWAVEAGSNSVAASEDVARALLRGVRRQQYEIYGNRTAAFAHWMHRFAPSVVRWTIDRPLRKHLKTRAQRTASPSPPSTV